MEQRAITQMEKSQKITKAEEKFRQAQAVYYQAVKDEKERIRKVQDRHKYMMGGCVLKYFPEGYDAYEFDESEMNRIIACAFSLRDVKNMVKTVAKERPEPDQDIATATDMDERGEAANMGDQNEAPQTDSADDENITGNYYENDAEVMDENEGEQS